MIACQRFFAILPRVTIMRGSHGPRAFLPLLAGCEKAGVLTEVRRREFYEKPTEIRKRKRAAAVKRHMKRMSKDITRRTRLY